MNAQLKSVEPKVFCLDRAILFAMKFAYMAYTLYYSNSNSQPLY